MRPNQQESFTFHDNHSRQGHFRMGNGGVRHSDRDMSGAGTAIIWVLRKTVQFIEKLIVLAKFQFYKRTAVAPSSLQVPWMKIGVVGALAFLAFKQDLTFSVGMGEVQRAQMGAAAVAEEVVLREHGSEEESGSWGLFSKKKTDYFANAPGDTKKDREIKEYIRRFKDVAIAEKERYGIPASVKMAQAIVESGAGSSGLARNNNNHFGIKCFSKSCKKGHCSNFGDDSHKDFFRKYGSAWESWRAHSEMIAGGRYKELLKYGDDYKKWAKGLKKLGYATAKHYEQTLVGMIEKYHLETLDD